MTPFASALPLCFCGGDDHAVLTGNAGPWCVTCLKREVGRLGLEFAMRRMYPLVDGVMQGNTVTVAEILSNLPNGCSVVG